MVICTFRLTDESDSLELTPVLPESSPKDGKKEPVTHVSFVKEITSSSKPAPLSSPVKSKAVVKPSPLKMKDDEEDDSPWDRYMYMYLLVVCYHIQYVQYIVHCTCTCVAAS